MRKVFVIAEAACTWRYGNELENAKRSIQAAKECGADAWKTQWTSDPKAMAARRGRPDADYSRLAWDKAWHPLLREACFLAGIEYMCTTYLPQDVAVVAQHSSYLKVSAFESQDKELIQACIDTGEQIFISLNPGMYVPDRLDAHDNVKRLHCISDYPTDIKNLSLLEGLTWFEGFSDHSTSLISGAVAVGAGASVVEKHVRMLGTPKEDPDYPHSMTMEYDGCNCQNYCPNQDFFGDYVKHIREAEVML